MRKTQSLLNYAILMVVVGLALVGMNKYFKRGVQGKVAGLSDAMIAPRADHLAYTDQDMVQNSQTIQDMNVSINLGAEGAQSKRSSTTATSNTHRVTEDEDYVEGDSSGNLKGIAQEIYKK